MTAQTVVAVVEKPDGGGYQIQTGSSIRFIVGLVVQLEAALEMPGLEKQREAVLAAIVAFDVGRLKAEIVLRGKF